MDSFTRWRRNAESEQAREDVAEGHEYAARITRQARGFTPVPAYQTLLAEGDTDAERRNAVDRWAYEHGTEAAQEPGRYCARIAFGGFRVTVMALPVRADLPSPAGAPRELAEVAAA